MKNRLAFYLLGLSPILLAFFVWDLDLGSNSQPNDPLSNRLVPDAIVINPSMSQYNLYGKVEQRIEGAQLLSFNTEDRLEITEPNFIFAESSGEQWDIYARHGNFFQDLNLFQLEGEVKMIRLAEDLPLSLSTSSMNIDLDDRTLLTRSSILIESPGHRISGNGFRADLNNNRFEIIGNVAARHDSI